MWLLVRFRQLGLLTSNNAGILNQRWYHSDRDSGTHSADISSNWNIVGCLEISLTDAEVHEKLHDGARTELTEGTNKLRKDHERTDTRVRQDLKVQTIHE